MHAQRNTVRGRFAPSPTGRLHLGNARTALLSWLQTRAAQGRFLLRIEDLDPDRSRVELETGQGEDLKYLGLDWDETPWRQSERSDVYASVLSQLRERDQIYPCYCSRAQIAQSASAPHGDEGPRYPGTCAQLDGAQRSERERTRRPAWRLRIPPGEVEFLDQVRGRFVQDVAREVGDFVVARVDGVASYQLAVVVDDAAAQITHVLRGDDLLTSTPRQMLLHGALSLVPPQYAHVPLLMGPDGTRLAKREGGSTVEHYRQRGVPATRLLGWLAQSVGLGDGSPTSAQSLVEGFSLSAISSARTVRPLPDLGLD